MSTRLAMLAIACVLAGTGLVGCGDDDEVAEPASEVSSDSPGAQQAPEPGPPTPPPVVEEPPPNREQLPVADDYQAEVEDQIDEKNYRAELDRLEKEIAATE